MFRQPRYKWNKCLINRLCALIAIGSIGACLERPLAAVPGVSLAAIDEEVRFDSAARLDLLLVIDNSGSMRRHQAKLLAQVEALVDGLATPKCRSRSNPDRPLHVCDPNDPAEVAAFTPIVDLHVGVISTDLGTPGFTVPGCDDSDRGDDGLLNPLRNGPAIQSHLPWAPRRQQWDLPPFYPAFCERDTNAFPSFITFCSITSDPSCDLVGRNRSTRNGAQFKQWFQCNAALDVNGCGLESPLEATWRALVEHGAALPVGSHTPNEGFLRSEATLAIVVLSDEEDGSVRNCARDFGFSAQTGGACDDATQVYNTASRQWSHPTNPDLRFYLYTPGDARDPTWSLDRYYNTAAEEHPNRWSQDLLSLKPQHPERILFVGVIGVPLEIPRQHGIGDILWDELLGPPLSAHPNDFDTRDSTRALQGVQGADGLEGPFSMRAANPDPQCVHVVPACREQGSVFDAARPCSNAQPMAFPSRRIVEVARRFDQYPACYGRPCRNGMVFSICANDFSRVTQAITQRIRPQRELYGRCLPRILGVHRGEDGFEYTDCLVRELLPEGQHQCDLSRGRSVPVVAEEQHWTNFSGVIQTVCNIEQIPIYPEGTPNSLQPASAEPGWFYDRRLDPSNRWCEGKIEFTRRGTPRSGSVVRLECTQRSAAR